MRRINPITALLLAKGESIFFGDIDEAFDRYARIDLQ
jgi:hypothetical protein